MAQGIRKKIDSRRAVGRDADGNGVGAGDTVLVLKGTYEGEKGTVKHIYRASLFLLVRSRTQNGGIIVTRTKLCRLKGNPRNRDNGITTFWSHAPQTPADSWRRQSCAAHTWSDMYSVHTPASEMYGAPAVPNSPGQPTTPGVPGIYDSQFDNEC